MSPSISQGILFHSPTIIILTAGAFVLDLLTPLGRAIWVLYFIPFAFTLRSPRAQDPYYYAIMATVLISVGAVSSHEGINPRVAYGNRSLVIGVL